MKDGIYFLHPEGSAWIAARFEDDELQATAYESDAGTHQAANDSWAGIVPQNTDVEVNDEDDCKEIILQVMGEDTLPELVVVTRPAPEYILHLHDEGGTHEVTSFAEEPDESDIHSEIEDWIKEGEWGDGGASVEVDWTLEKDGDEIDNGWYTVEIEPNEEALIKAAGGDINCDHDWTAEGEGGCTENPGVWSTGGTSMSFATHCRKCGLHRTEYSTGSQRNPGEHDTVSFEQPASWCSECEHQECEYPDDHCPGQPYS